jgi:hypothetical protein
MRVGVLSWPPGDILIAERQPDGKARYVVAVGGERIRTTNLVNMTPPLGFDLFSGSVEGRSDIAAIERTSRTSSRLMVGEWGGPSYFGWGFTNVESAPVMLKFAMGDVDGDTDGDGVAIVRSTGSSRLAVMTADRPTGDFEWRLSGPSWSWTPLFMDVGHLD